MESLRWRTLKTHPPLVVLLAICGGGCVGAGLYLMRLATKNPDVIINKKGRDGIHSPWLQYGPTYQHKFYAAKFKYKDLKYPAERPNLEE